MSTAVCGQWMHASVWLANISIGQKVQENNMWLNLKFWFHFACFLLQSFCQQQKQVSELIDLP